MQLTLGDKESCADVPCDISDLNFSHFLTEVAMFRLGRWHVLGPVSRRSKIFRKNFQNLWPQKFRNLASFADRNAP